MRRIKLFAMLNVARRQLKERGLASDAVFVTREAMRHTNSEDAMVFVDAYLDMVLAPLPTAPKRTEDS